MSSEIEPLPAISEQGTFDFHAVFLEQYPRVVRIVFRIIQDRSRSEDIAVEVFWKLWRTPRVQGDHVNGWLYRAAIRMGLDDLRRRSRRERYERLISLTRPAPTPEQLHSRGEQQANVRSVLSSMISRDAELLILRSEGLSYQELSEVLGLNPVSVGTLLRRAQQTFRRKYERRYGKQN